MIHNPGNKKPYDMLWAVLSQDEKGREGICAINTPIGPQVAITGEKRMLELYVDILSSDDAATEARKSKMKIIVAEFKRTSERVVLE